MPSSRLASAPALPSNWEGPACEKVLLGTKLSLVPGSFIHVLGTEEEQWGGKAPPFTPIYTHSPGPKASLSLLSGASPGHTDQEE